MLRILLRLLGLLTLIGIILPAAAALLMKRRIESAEGPIVDDTADLIDLAAIYDSRELDSRAAAFRGGRVLAWYGAARLDLRDATIDPDGAHLRLRSIYGGLEVIVPPTWRVAVASRGIFDGSADMTDARPDEVADERPVLAIDSLAIFGGVTISNHAHDDDDELEDTDDDEAAWGDPDALATLEAPERADSELTPTI